MVSRWCVVSALLASCAHKNTACPCYRTHRADGCVPAADSDPDQAGPESHGQGRGAGQVDCAYASFIHSLHAPPAKCFWRRPPVFYNPVDASKLSMFFISIRHLFSSRRVHYV